VTPRAPAPILILDSNIILSVALGLPARPVFADVQLHRALLTSFRAREEVLRIAEGLDQHAEEALAIASMLFEIVTVVEEALYLERLAAAAEALRLAVPSRNGSAKDAHILALAWTVDGDIWSHDRDFAGTGWPSWSSANLRSALGAERGLHQPT
jgi:predicted nucleic acid-binding protein